VSGQTKGFIIGVAVGVALHYAYMASTTKPQA
jgi:hypothetical protein